MTLPHYDIALAIVRRDGMFLVSRRPVNVHLGGLWEFPGGKIEYNETPSAAALRELHEETGVHAVAERVLEPIRYRYEDRAVRLVPVLCTWTDGEPQPLASDECRWVSLADLDRLEMPAINARLLQLLHEAQERPRGRGSGPAVS